MGYAKTMSLASKGLDLFEVAVEAVIDSTSTAGEFEILGLDERVARQVRARVECALRESGYSAFGLVGYVNVGVACAQPCDCQVDLAIAAAVLAAAGKIDLEKTQWEGCALVGRLAFDGSVLPCENLHVYAQSRTRFACNPGPDAAPSPASPIVAIGGLGDLSGTLEPFKAAPCPAQDVEPAGEDDSILLVDPCILTLICAAIARVPVYLEDDGKADADLTLSVLHRILPALDDGQAAQANATAQLSGRDPVYRKGSCAPCASALSTDALPDIFSGLRPLRCGYAVQAANGLLCLPDAEKMPKEVLRRLAGISRAGHIDLADSEGLTRLPANFWLVGKGPSRHRCTKLEREALSSAFPIRFDMPVIPGIDPMFLSCAGRLVEKGRAHAAERLDGAREETGCAYERFGLTGADIVQVRQLIRKCGFCTSDFLTGALMLRALADLLGQEAIAHVEPRSAMQVLSCMQ